MSFLVLATLGVCVALLGAARTMKRREPPWRAVHTLRLIMVGALAVGTSTHLENMLRAGFLPLPEQPLAFNVYWTSLTLLDPLAASLLVVRPHLGLILSVAIMLSDIAVNSVAFRPFSASPTNWIFWSQLAFAVFLVSVSPYCWKRLGNDD